MSNYIPFVLQVKILKSLPVKSLIRFRSVSKEWKHKIDSSEFVTGYNVSQQHFFVSYLDLDDRKLKFASIMDDDAFPQHKFSVSPPLSVQPFGTQKIVGSSQGLFCLYDSETKVATIWNPSIRKSVDISTVPSIHLPNWPSGHGFGFGVCPITSDPKLIKITYLKRIFDRNSEKISGSTWRVEVFRLSTREWTSVCINWSNNIELYSDQVDIVGHIYWAAVKSECLMIVSYDITTEEFTEISFPDIFKGDMFICLSKLRDALAVVRFDQTSGFGVWKMENGDHKSFTKFFTVKNIFEATIFNVVGFSMSGEPIFKRANGDKKDALVVYEPWSKRLSYKGKEYYFNVRYYMESLLLHDQ